jgi:hypothetical protein
MENPPDTFPSFKTSNYWISQPPLISCGQDSMMPFMASVTDSNVQSMSENVGDTRWIPMNVQFFS